MMKHDITRPSVAPSISVIVPVYDVEEWLTFCLDSLRTQSCQDWECIVVIDGSPDNSEKIARDFAALDPRFVVIVTANAGLGAARNTGLMAARGRWVFFLDSDDVVPSNALEALRSVGESDSADMVCGVGVDLHPDGSTSTYWTQGGTIFNRRWVAITAKEQPTILDDHVAWNKLYRRSFLEEFALRFTPGVHCEDLLFSAAAASRASAISIAPTVVYHHRRHGAAISADYMRPKTLTDWMSESWKAFDVLEAAGSEMLAHYVQNFVVRQWWTRAQRAHRLSTDALLTAFEEFSSRVSSLLRGASFRLPDSLALSAIGFVADQGFSRCWRNPSAFLNPFDRSEASPAELLETTLSALELLDRAKESHRQLALALIKHRVVPAFAEGGWGAGSDDGQRLWSRARDYVHSLDDEDLAELLPPSTEKRPLTGVDFDAVLVHNEALSSVLVERITSLDAVTFMGAAHVPLAVTGVSDLTVVLRSQTSKRVRTFAASWREATEPDHISWESTVRLDDDLLEQEWRCWIRVHRTGFPARDSLLKHAIERETSLDIPTRRQNARLRFIPLAGIGSPWLAHIFPEKTDGAPKLEPHPAGHSMPRGVFAFADHSASSYLTLLQMEARAQGREVRHSDSFEELIAELRSARSQQHVHLHSIDLASRHAVTARKVGENADRLVDAVRGAVSRDRKVIWTPPHNLVSKSVLPDTAVRLRRDLTAAVSILHVFNSNTATLLAQQNAQAASKIKVIPHSSYPGVYGAAMLPERARAQLGADSHDTAVLLFGELRPSRGLEQVVRAISKVGNNSNPRQLLLPGNVSPEAMALISSIADSHIRTVRTERSVEDDDVGAWMCASDVLVVPDSEEIKWDWVLLAASFGVPCILPARQHLVWEFGDRPWVRFFPVEGDVIASIDNTLTAGFYLDARVRTAALSDARENSPVLMSRAYAHLLASLDPQQFRSPPH